MFAVDDGLMSGNLNAADILFLVAAIIFVLAAVLALSPRPEPRAGALVPLGLALVAIGWLVL